MKHAFSNMIKILISKLLAYLISTFCNKLVREFTTERTVVTVSNKLLQISEQCCDTVYAILKSKEDSTNDSVEEVKHDTESIETR